MRQTEKRQRRIEALHGMNRALIERMNKLMLCGRKSLSLGKTCLALNAYNICKCKMFGTFQLFLIALLTPCHGLLILVLVDLFVMGKLMALGVKT